MLKKLVIGGVVLGAATGLLVGRDAWSYVGTSVGWVKDSVRESVPVEFQIERARKMHRELGPAIREAKNTVFREEAELEKLAKEIDAVEQQLAAQEQQLMKLKTDLTGGGETFQYAGRSYSAEQVKCDLARRFKRFQTKEETLASLRKVYDARQQGLSAARDNVDGMLAAQRQLEVEIENVAARGKMVAAAQTTSNFHFDDSELSRLKQLVDDIDTRLQVEEKMVHLDEHFSDEIPLDEVAPADIVDQVTSYFETKPAGGVAQVSEKTAD